MKRIIKKAFRLIFEWGQFAGLDILPRHFYAEIPDIRELKKDRRWMKPRSMQFTEGSELNGQIDFAAHCCSKEALDALAASDIYKQACIENGHGGYGPVEADFLYCFARRFKPRKIVQVGCGVSTAILLSALRDSAVKTDLVCIEPFPGGYLKKQAAEGRIRLVAKKMQDVPLADLTALQAGDFLFVDSTHTVKPGSEVNEIIFEVLPRLREGVFVHFHDIYFPYDYQRTVLHNELFFHNESSLLHAFLMLNHRFRIRVSLSMLHYFAADRLKEFVPRYVARTNEEGLDGRSGQHFPSAIYLSVTGGLPQNSDNT